ncbi:MAG: membrane integrity-associated transporter subunit PqiC [Gammaproteobacteria bacterium]|nr:membrane integrity-associated transporter subunit PqiC [Gammaproteobacteria bacterium]
MKTPLCALAAALLAGCSLLPKPPLPPVLHDFGPATSAPAATVVPAETTVSAPAWLDGSEIYYRLIFSDPTQLRAYADNRWLAPPAELLQARLQAAFAGGRAGGYRLHVNLLDFEQEFASAQSAHVSVRAVVELQSLSSGATVAQHLFAVSVPVSPDVQGAVQGASRAADELLAQLVQWTRAQLAGAKRK